MGLGGLLFDVGIWVACQAIDAARRGTNTVAASGPAVARWRGRHRPGIPRSPEPVHVPLSVVIGQFVVSWGVPGMLTLGGYLSGAVFASDLGPDASVGLAIAGLVVGMIYFFAIGRALAAWFD